jgi:hypothetical protein
MTWRATFARPWKAAALAKSMRRKAVDADAAAAAVAAAVALPHLKAMHLASRAFVCVAFATSSTNAASSAADEDRAEPAAPSTTAAVPLLSAAAAAALVAGLAAAGYVTARRPDGVEAAPARSRAAAAIIIIASAAARDDPGVAAEVAAAAAAGRRVIVLADERSVSGDASPWKLLPEEACALEPAPVVVTHPPGNPAGAVEALARYLGAPDDLLAMLPASALAAVAAAAASSGGLERGVGDLVGLAGVTSLRLDMSSALPGIAAALASVLTSPTATLKALQLPGCHPNVAAEVSAAALRCGTLMTLSFGGCVLPVGAIRRAVSGGGGLTELDLTAGVTCGNGGGGGGVGSSSNAGGGPEAVWDGVGGDDGDSKGGGSGGRAAGVLSTSDGGIGVIELAAVAGMLGGRMTFVRGSGGVVGAGAGAGSSGVGRSVVSLTLLPW